MKTTWLISDTHFNHDRIATYCDRPLDFTDRIIKRWQEIVQPEDLIIHLGDVAIGNRRTVKSILADLPGRKVLVLGNHDRMHGPDWWMEQGFAFACQALRYRNCWLTHEPSPQLPDGCTLNIHGHLHNIWHGFHPGPYNDTVKDKWKPWQRLFAIEYTNYMPVNFDKFIAHPHKYKSVPPPWSSTKS